MVKGMPQPISAFKLLMPGTAEAASAAHAQRQLLEKSRSGTPSQSRSYTSWYLIAGFALLVPALAGAVLLLVPWRSQVIVADGKPQPDKGAAAPRDNQVAAAPDGQRGTGPTGPGPTGPKLPDLFKKIEKQQPTTAAPKAAAPVEPVGPPPQSAVKTPEVKAPAEKDPAEKSLASPPKSDVATVERRAELAAPATVVEPPPAPRPAPGTVEVKEAKKLLDPGKVFRDCDHCPEMVVLPRGQVLIGSSPAEIAALKQQNPVEQAFFDRESPQLTVRIAYPMAVGRTHVTRGEFAAFIKATGHAMLGGCSTHTSNEWRVDPSLSWSSPGFTQTDRHPVVCVNFLDASAYVDWLSRTTGRPYRLLSESEAEYAARGQVTATRAPSFSFGDDPRLLCAYANGGDLSGAERFADWDRRRVAPCRDGHVQTAPAGSFKPNAFGLYDVHGNAWTWTLDCDSPGHQGQPADGRARTVGGDCARRIIRGGAWQDVAILLRSASRYDQDVARRDDNTGFRIALTLSE